MARWITPMVFLTTEFKAAPVRIKREALGRFLVAVVYVEFCLMN